MRLRALLILAFVIPVCAWAQVTPDADFCAGSAGTGDERIAACTRAITAGTLSTPNLAITFSNRGFEWRAKGDQDRAIADYTEAIRLNPQFANAFDNRGNAWRAKGDTDRAIADYTEAIRLNPQDADFFINRGNAWRAKGDPDRAIADYTEAIRLNPRLTVAYNNRGVAYRAKGDLDRAIADCTEAIRLNPQYANAFFNRGIAKFFKGPVDAAASDFSEAIRLDATNAYARIWRYLARARGGDVSVAREELLTGATRLDKGKWPTSVIDVLLGRVEPGALLTAAKSPDAQTERGQTCEAHFYLGEFYLVAGQPPLARTYLVDAARDCPKDYIGYSAAEAELTRVPR